MANNVMSGWREIKLGDLVKNTIDNRGKNAPLDTEGIIPLLESNLLKAGDRYPDLASASKFVNIETYQNWFRSGHPNPKDVLITTVGNIGKVALMPQDKGCIAQNIIAMQYKEDIDSTFMYYCLSQPNIQSYIQALNISSVQPSIKVGHLYSIPVNIPPLEVQKKIAGVLGALDDKIELNNKINQNLELQAQALFKSWFVDFEPFGGTIPSDWKEIQLTEIADFIGGYSYKGAELKQSTTAMATIKNFDRNGGFKLDGYKEIEPSSKLKQNQYVELFDTLVAHTDLTQNAEVIGNAEMLLSKGKYKNVIISMDVVRVVPKNGISKYLLAAILKDPHFKNHCLGYVNGTTVLHLSKRALPEYSLIFPKNVKILDNISGLFEDLYKKIALNIEENIRLSILRDTLLPKLMSGEINVDNVDISEQKDTP